MTTLHYDPRTSVIEPQTLAFLRGLETQGGPPLYTLTPAEARKVLVAVQASAKVTTLPAEIEDRTLAGGPTGEISLRIVRPQGVTGTLPGIIYCDTLHRLKPRSFCVVTSTDVFSLSPASYADMRGKPYTRGGVKLSRSVTLPTRLQIRA